MQILLRTAIVAWDPALLLRLLRSTLLVAVSLRVVARRSSVGSLLLSRTLRTIVLLILRTVVTLRLTEILSVLPIVLLRTTLLRHVVVGEVISLRATSIGSLTIVVVVVVASTVVVVVIVVVVVEVPAERSTKGVIKIT